MAWLGLQTQVVTPELARLLGTPELRGFRITEVYPWTEAARSGLAIGDVITALDDEALEAERVQDGENLKRAIESRAIGETVELAVLRGSEARRLSVRLEARPRSADEARTARQRELEFAVRELVFLDRIERRLELEDQGVLVTEVTSGGWAQMAGLSAGDLIRSIGGRPIADVAAFEQAMVDVLAERAPTVAVFVRRGWRTHYVFLEPEWSELALPAGGSP
jgi:serine protease Do